jgi:hypothetical protein
MIDAGHSRRLSDTSKYRIVQLSSFSPFLPTDSFSHLRRPHTTLWNMTPMLDRCDANIITTLIMQAANQALDCGQKTILTEHGKIYLPVLSRLRTRGR